MDILKDLKPQKVFYYFEQICRIPHGSGDIDRLSDYLAAFAKERKLVCIQDELKNVIIIKEPAPGYEKEAPIILQGHMDMVAVKKPGASIDMEKQGLELKVDGDYVYAENTSLGGDDGIAVAYALAILDDETLQHPKLEIIITVDEEVGMDGARGIDVSMLEGKRMLNLDSEEEGILWAGCAGGARVDWSVPVTWEMKNGSICEVSIKGLSGGHSGAEIDKERGNANCLLGRLMEELQDMEGFSIAQLAGGLADNAIPREASAAVIVDSGKETELMAAIKRVEAELKQELQTKDPGVFIEAADLVKGSIRCLTEESVKKVSYLLFTAPNGVQAMSADIQGLVETSLNMGVMELKENAFEAHFSVRSSLESAKWVLIRRLKRLVETAGGTQGVQGDYPGWTYQVHSPFRDMAAQVYREMFKTEPEVRAIHAGLECGLLSAKIPGLECISIGPDMKDIHTTEERLSISSTERMWNYVLEILKQK